MSTYVESMSMIDMDCRRRKGMRGTTTEETFVAPEAGRKYSSRGTGRIHSMMKTELVATACNYWIRRIGHPGDGTSTRNMLSYDPLAQTPPLDFLAVPAQAMQRTRGCLLCPQVAAYQPKADLDALDAVADAAAVALRRALPADDEGHARGAVPPGERPQPDRHGVPRQVVHPLLAGRPAGQIMPPVAARLSSTWRGSPSG